MMEQEVAYLVMAIVVSVQDQVRTTVQPVLKLTLLLAVVPVYVQLLDSTLHLAPIAASHVRCLVHIVQAHPLSAMPVLQTTP